MLLNLERYQVMLVHDLCYEEIDNLVELDCDSKEERDQANYSIMHLEEIVAKTKELLSK